MFRPPLNVTLDFTCVCVNCKNLLCGWLPLSYVQVTHVECDVQNKCKQSA